MAVVTKANVPAPTLPKETVTLEGVGDVIVRGLLLSDRLQLFGSNKDGRLRLSDLLAKTVTDAKGEPIWDAEQWEVFGAANFKAALDVYQVARRLSGLDAEIAAKN